jgi:hypothetical protein
MNGRIPRRWRILLAVALVLAGGLALQMTQAPAARAVVGAYVELHVVECPPGYTGDDLYTNCHENRVPGVAFSTEGAGDEFYTGVSDADGILFFSDFYTAGMVTIAEQVPSGDYSDYLLFCSTVDGQEPLPVESRGNGRAAGAFDLPQWVIDSGTGVVCDWYYFSPGAQPAPAHTPTAQPLPATEAPSFGLGLTRTEWEEIHGEGTPGQTVVTYQGGRYAVGFSAGMVTFIETEWADLGSITAAEAAEIVASMLPPDSRLVERYELLPTPSGPIGLHVERYESSLLAERLAGQPLFWNGSLIVVYHLEERGAESDPLQEPRITRISIAAGSETTGL